MKLGWFIASIIVWLASFICIITTIHELATGKNNLKKLDFWGAVIFHGITAILALWLFLKATGKV